MESIFGVGVQAPVSSEVLAGTIKDNTGVQIINKTLEKLNANVALPGQAADSDYQFQKDVLNAAGIGNKLDITL